MSSDILNDLATDSSRDAGSLFAELVARYLEETRAELGPVSTSLSVEEIAQRFDEPLPRQGKPLREVVDRIARDAVCDANHLTDRKSVVKGQCASLTPRCTM